MDFPPVYGTLNEIQLFIEGTTKPRGGYPYTVYFHGIPLFGKKYDVAFHFDLVFEGVRVFYPGTRYEILKYLLIAP